MWLNSYRPNFQKSTILFPLQTHTDYQIRTHSNYDSMEAFIKEVLFSFAKHALKELFLIYQASSHGSRDKKLLTLY